MRWRQILEEYSAELIYLPGDKNKVEDALSHLGMLLSTNIANTLNALVPLNMIYQLTSILSSTPRCYVLNSRINIYIVCYKRCHIIN
jgi:hypothetical protein